MRIWASLLLVSLGVGASPAVAQDVRGLSAQLDQVAAEIQRLETEYRVIPDLTGQGNFDQRLNQGETFLLLKNYERAALLLYGAVVPSSNAQGASLPSHARYPDAVFGLAESLFFMKNYQGARTYYDMLLRLKNHDHHEIAIKRLIQVLGRLQRYDEIDEYWAMYQEQASTIPGEIVYLRGRAQFLSGQIDDAVETLILVPVGDTWYLRAQYTLGAAYVAQASKLRADDPEYERILREALTLFTQIAQGKPVAREDKKVIELAHMARGRILFDLDELNGVDGAVNAYQYIPYDSPLLPTMLYEVTWTYVRRGQKLLHSEEGTELERVKAANREYELALEQLHDLRALTPLSERADIDILAGNLLLQKMDYDEARQRFESVLERVGPADNELRTLMEDPEQRARMLQDILTLESGGLSVDTKLPPIVAKRAAKNKEVADAIRVFKDIEASRAEIAATEKMLVKLERALQTKSKDQLFRPVASALSRSSNTSTTLLRISGAIADMQYKLVQDLPPEKRERVERLRARRMELEEALSSIATSGQQLKKRVNSYGGKLARLETLLHEQELEIKSWKAQIAALDRLFADARTARTTQPKALERQRKKLRQMRETVDEWEAEALELSDEIANIRTQLRLSGGRGEDEGDIRRAYQIAVDRENAFLRSVLGAKGAKLAAMNDRVTSLMARNQAFKSRVDAVVERQVGVLRQLINSEREHLAQYREQVETVNAQAADYRDYATSIALEHVRSDLNKIVVRADVGVIDVAFQLKQKQTEKIGRLQRQKSIELTDLNQAYADLQRDEVQ